jgi:hypothetical protein
MFMRYGLCLLTQEFYFNLSCKYGEEERLIWFLFRMVSAVWKVRLLCARDARGCGAVNVA